MALLTQKAILSTFEEMLEEMPFDKITVSALVRRCGVSSNTFYYHYQDIYDLLDVWMSTRLGMLKKSVPESKGWKEEVRVFLKYCQSHPKLVTNLLSSTSRRHLEQYIFTESDIFFYDYVRERTAGMPLSEESIRSTSRRHLEQYIFTESDIFFYDYVRERTAGMPLSEESIRYIAQFYRYSFIGFFLKFTWEKMQTDVDESVDRLEKLFNAFIDSAAAQMERDPL